MSKLSWKQRSTGHHQSWPCTVRAAYDSESFQKRLDRVRDHPWSSLSVPDEWRYADRLTKQVAYRLLKVILRSTGVGVHGHTVVIVRGERNRGKGGQCGRSRC